MGLGAETAARLPLRRSAAIWTTLHNRMEARVAAAETVVQVPLPAARVETVAMAEPPLQLATPRHPFLMLQLIRPQPAAPAAAAEMAVTVDLPTAPRVPTAPAEAPPRMQRLVTTLGLLPR